MKKELRIDYVIWSFEHDAWWKPGRSGYTQDLYQAGLYTAEDAARIVEDANRFIEPGEKPNEEFMKWTTAVSLDKERRETQESDEYDRRTCHQA